MVLHDGTDLILDELQKNNVDIDMRTLLYHTSYLLKHHEMTYNEMVARVKPDELSTIFSEINVNNFGHAMAFLTHVYVLKGSKDVMRRAVRLVAVVLKDMDLAAFKVEESFLQRIREGSPNSLHVASSGRTVLPCSYESHLHVRCISERI